MQTQFAQSFRVFFPTRLLMGLRPMAVGLRPPCDLSLRFLSSSSALLLWKTGCFYSVLPVDFSTPPIPQFLKDRTSRKANTVVIHKNEKNRFLKSSLDFERNHLLGCTPRQKGEEVGQENLLIREVSSVQCQRTATQTNMLHKGHVVQRI